MVYLVIGNHLCGDDPKAPDHLVSGECIGSFLIKPNGKTDARVFYARKDKDGDVLNEEGWSATVGHAMEP